MSMIQVNLLGVPELRFGDEVHSLRLRNAVALLGYLAVSACPHSRKELATLLWPEAAECGGRAALRATLSCLRLGLGDLGWAVSNLRGATGIVELAPDALTVDVHEWATAAALAQQRTELPCLRGTLERAIQAYHGDFLSGFSVPDAPNFYTWILPQRERCRRHLRAVLVRLAALQEGKADLQAVVKTLERWMAFDPLEKEACQRLLAAYLTLGDVATGLQTYQTYRALLAAEPGLEIRVLAEQLQVARSPAAARLTRKAALSGRVLELPLVGRATHLVALQHHLAQAQHGRCQVVVLEGETGSGKTRLAREFLSGVRAETDVLEGRAVEVGGCLPYNALLEALRSRLECENAQDDLLSDVWLAELARLLPELRERYPDLPPLFSSPAESSAHISEAVVRLMQALEGRRTVILFLDDVQWADTATRDLLLYAAQRWAAGSTRLLLILAVRAEDEGTAPNVAAWLRRLGLEVHLARLGVGLLDDLSTRRLVEILAGVVPGHTASAVAKFAAWLHAETGGVPFAIAETLRMLLEEGSMRLHVHERIHCLLDVAAVGHEPWQMCGVLPPQVQEAIEARLGQLDSRAIALLVADAVLGTRFTFEEACRAAEIPEWDGLAAPDTLVRGRLLREEGELGWYSFAHGRVRDVVYARAGAARRQVVQRHYETVARAECEQAAQDIPSLALVNPEPQPQAPGPPTDPAVGFRIGPADAVLQRKARSSQTRGKKRFVVVPTRSNGPE